MAEKEKSTVRGMTVEQTRSWSLLKFLEHVNKLEDSTRDPNNKIVGRGKSPDLSGSVVCRNSRTDYTSREPVPITCVWPRPSLEAVLADLRGNGSTDLNPQHPEFPSSLPLTPPSQPRADHRNFESKENSSRDPDNSYIYIYAPSLDERDSRSERGKDSSEEGDDSGDEDYIPNDGCKDQDSSEEEDDSGDEDYIPKDGCKDQDPCNAQLECRRSSRKRTIEEKSSPESQGLLLDSSKSTGSKVLVFRRSKTCGGEEWSVVPIDEGQIAAQVSQGILSGSRGKLRNCREEVASTSNISSQVLSFNQNDGVGAKEDSLLRNSGKTTLFGIVEEIEEFQKRCQEAKESLVRYKETYPSSLNSTDNLKRREKWPKFGITETTSACPAELGIQSARPQGRRGKRHQVT